jgi:hypothetical protein
MQAQDEWETTIAVLGKLPVKVNIGRWRAASHFLENRIELNVLLSIK